MTCRDLPAPVSLLLLSRVKNVISTILDDAGSCSHVTKRADCHKKASCDEPGIWLQTTQPLRRRRCNCRRYAPRKFLVALASTIAGLKRGQIITARMMGGGYRRSSARCGCSRPQQPAKCYNLISRERPTRNVPVFVTLKSRACMTAAADDAMSSQGVPAGARHLNTEKRCRLL